MKNKTVLMASVLAIATVLAAGLTVLPGSVQEAQANPCSNNQDATNDESGGSSSGAGATGDINTGNQECTFIGPTDFDE